MTLISSRLKHHITLTTTGSTPGGRAREQFLGDGVAAGGAHDAGGARHADADAAADAPDDAGQAAGGRLAPDRRLALEEPLDAPALRHDNKPTSIKTSVMW